MLAGMDVTWVISSSKTRVSRVSTPTVITASIPLDGGPCNSR